jgi:hypothetical protein
MKTPLDFRGKPPVQGPVGKSPASYLKELPGDQKRFEASISSIPGNGARKLTRAEVRALCRDMRIHSLVAYACVMAWGGRNFSNYRLTLSRPSISNLETLLGYLRAGNGSREEDFAHTQQAAKGIKGLGISFYTKLLFFFRPKADAYILDQWTAKSAVFLFSECGVKLSSSGLPRADTSPGDYGRFCAKLDALAGPNGWGSNWRDGEEIELTLFDEPEGDWRNFVKSVFPAEAADEQASATPLSEVVPKFDKSDDGQRFAANLAKIYGENETDGVDLPRARLSFHETNRLYCRKVNGVIWQFVLNGKTVSAQIYFDAERVSLYEELVKKTGAKVRTIGGKEVCDFGVNIHGDFDRDLVHRRITLKASHCGGNNSPDSVWPDISQSSIDAMHLLFERFGPLI